MPDELDTRLREARDRLPGPDDADTAAARARFLAAAAAAPRRPRVAWRRSAAVALAVAVAAGGAFGAGYAVASGDDEPAPEPPRQTAGPGFLPTPGWDVVASAAGAPARAPAATTANVPLRAEDRAADGPPLATARRLGPNGVLLHATFRPAAGGTAAPQRLLPLQLRDARPVASPVGGAARRLRARVAAYEVDVTVYLGAERPEAGVLAAAAQALRRLVVPSCPDAVPVGEDDLPAARAFVLAWLRTHYQDDPADLAGARATATLGPAMPRGGAARAACGDTVWRRTIEVDVVLPRIEAVSASLSQHSYFVARTPQGWEVWQRIH